MIIPSKITILSDGNILEFVKEEKGKYTYKYVKSISKKNQLLILTEQELLNLINNNL